MSVTDLSIEQARMVLREYGHASVKTVSGLELTPELRKAAVGVAIRERLDDVVVCARGGGLMQIRPQTDGVTSRFLLMDGVYEAPTHVFIRHVLRPGDVYIDIGANIGCHAVTASLCVGDEGQVVCFEPNPEIRRLLEQNMRLNEASNMIVRPFAIAEEEGGFKLVVNAVHPGNGVLTPQEQISKDSLEVHEESLKSAVGANMIPLPGQGLDVSGFGDLKPRVYDVEVRTLASQLTAGQVENARLVKVDVEGAEMSVLRSGAMLWDAPHPPIVIVEYEERYPGARAEIYDMFNERGWAAYIVSEGEHEKPTLNRLSEPFVLSQFENIYLVPPHLIDEIEFGCLVFDYPHDEMRRQGEEQAAQQQ